MRRHLRSIAASIVRALSPKVDHMPFTGADLDEAIRRRQEYEAVIHVAQDPRHRFYFDPRAQA